MHIVGCTTARSCRDGGRWPAYRDNSRIFSCERERHNLIRDSMVPISGLGDIGKRF